MSSGNIIVGGIEGGATHSKLMLFDAASMKALATVEGPSTNVFILGLEETCKRIHEMGLDALKRADVDGETQLKSLGMSLSGCEREETNRELVGKMKKLFPGFCAEYAAVSDTRGTLATASEKGGIVLIAGTGSNALLINPDGSTARCGGHGHLLGDEASATWVAFRACKTYFDHVDNKEACDLPVDGVKAAIFEHFGLSDRFDIYLHYYEKFDKTFIASLCKRLAELAEKGDRLCARLFADAGREMAKHLLAMADSISPDLINASGGLPVVCIGSVWKSWRYMEPGFTRELKEHSRGRLKAVQLLQLKVPMPVGACYLGAAEAKVDIPKNYAENTFKFFETTL